MSNDVTPEERLAADLAGGGDDECTWCARAPGLILIGAGALLLYIGADIVTGGLLTRWLSGAAALAPADAEAAEAAVPPDTVTVVAGEVAGGGEPES
jgi:hypothetical protein